MKVSKMFAPTSTSTNYDAYYYQALLAGNYHSSPYTSIVDSDTFKRIKADEDKESKKKKLKLLI